MRLFVIHRFKEKQQARAALNSISKQYSIPINPIFLDSSTQKDWKQQAINSIQNAEAIIVFNKSSCEASDNALWEIEQAKASNKEIIFLDCNGNNDLSASRLKSLYDFEEDFERCFSSNTEHLLELYKIMIDSSEKLIQRRQTTNTFFITAISSLLAIAGLLSRCSAINKNGYYLIIYFILFAGILLCNSWKNLIDNYGKLNKGKFAVISRLEKELGTQIYTAEWIALGKGMRPNKYRSFTSTESKVPMFFCSSMYLLLFVILFFQLSGL